MLDGGLPKWVAESRPTVAGEQPQIMPAVFKATYRPHLVRELGQMMENYHSKTEQVADTLSTHLSLSVPSHSLSLSPPPSLFISSSHLPSYPPLFLSRTPTSLPPSKVVDNRPKGRYDGIAPEPDDTLRSGHILGSMSVPFMNLINPDTKMMKDKDGIKQGIS